jgi:hypothetical protein
MSVSPVLAVARRLNGNNISMVEKFRGGALSAELFTLPNGVNEFDLIKVGGIYYFAQDDKTTTQLRSASTIAGLATATATAPVSTLRFPTIQFDGTTWHLWGQQISENKVHHYTAPAFAGPYTDIDQMTTYGDVSVRRFSNGKWYMGYLDGRDSTRPAGVLVAESPNGPWANLGKFFADIGRSPTHTGEEDDLCVWEADGRVYLTFSAFDGIDQTKGQLPNITELDPNTFRAKAQSVNLVNPTQAWQQRNNQFKLFNPVFLREDAAPDRIYYSHNVSTTGVASGWGYIEVGAPPVDNRRDLQSANVDFRAANLDLATGLIPTLHGSTTLDPRGLVLTTATGGAYGIPNIPNLDDFAICIDFTANSLPAAGAFNILFRLSKRTEDANFIGLWITTSASGVTTIASQVGNTAVASWTTAFDCRREIQGRADPSEWQHTRILEWHR